LNAAFGKLYMLPSTKISASLILETSSSIEKEYYQRPSNLQEFPVFFIFFWQEYRI
jgi:hypothetical protein